MFSKYVKEKYIVTSAVMFKEYPDIEFPKKLHDLGFEDQSWHNDACAAAWKTLPSGKVLVAWVDYDNPNDREMSNDKFALVLMDDDDSYGDPEKSHLIISTDSLDDLLKAIHQNMNK